MSSKVPLPGFVPDDGSRVAPADNVWESFSKICLSYQKLLKLFIYCTVWVPIISPIPVILVEQCPLVGKPLHLRVTLFCNTVFLCSLNRLVQEIFFSSVWFFHQFLVRSFFRQFDYGFRWFIPVQLTVVYQDVFAAGFLPRGLLNQSTPGQLVGLN